MGWRLRAELTLAGFLLAWGGQPFSSRLEPSGWAHPHYGEQSVFLKVCQFKCSSHLKNTFIATSRIMFDQIAGYCGHQMNHHIDSGPKDAFHSPSADHRKFPINHQHSRWQHDRFRSVLVISHPRHFFCCCFLFLAVPTVWRSSWSRDGTCLTATTPPDP